jgi:flagellar protein FliO/FliZ
MMLAYILKLLILVPLVAGLAYGSLWLWRRLQPGMAFGQRERAIKLIDAIPVGAMGRLPWSNSPTAASSSRSRAGGSN